ncbi:SDR family oxidoreductase [Novosphingobium flavum]|uniref:SDR family oxidoreductase n=1 Tax=Novosphingobium flavum TaxID=1778672 RepID=A0A7X1FTT0_9SPHN|nr:SDR family oxidoreductase [Novosphingobium flavum]MBC2666828.1 SDR family oxidoreductase [Novosphingobium flavum]
MDLGIKGRKAIVCASSKGLGLACATALAREGAEVWINGRDQGRLDEAAARIKAETGAEVHTIPADIDTEEGRGTLLAACPEPDILVNNNAGPPPGKMADWSYDDWMKGIHANMLAPIFLIKAVVPGMRARKFGRIINITSAMVKSPSATMGLSTSVRTALTAFSKSVHQDTVIDNVTINNLLPERFNTDRQKFMAERMSRNEGITVDEAYQKIANTIAAKRLGDPAEFGDACAYLCSAQAGFISGQNLQLDGGSYRGLV